MRKLIEFLLLRCGYVRDEELSATQEKLREASRMVVVLSASLIQYRDWLATAEQESAIIGEQLGTMLGRQATTIEQLQEELDITTGERDLALMQAKFETA